MYVGYKDRHTGYTERQTREHRGRQQEHREKDYCTQRDRLGNMKVDWG